MPLAYDKGKAAALLAFLTVYLFVLGGLVYNYQPVEGPLSPFFPSEEKSHTENRPSVLACGDLDGDGKDEVVVGWEDGLVEVYSPADGTISNSSVDGSVMALFISGGMLFSLSIDGSAAVFVYESGRLSLKEEYSVSSGITDCALISKGNGSVSFAYTAPGKNLIGIYTLSMGGVVNEASLHTQYAGYGIDYLPDLNGTDYIAVVNLVDVRGMTLYPLKDGLSIGEPTYLDTGSRVTSALSGSFLPGARTMATTNYDMNTLSIYRTDSSGEISPHLIMNISTDAAPYTALAVDIDGDYTDEICVLNFKSHTLMLIYPAINATIRYPVGRSPVALSMWHSPDGYALSILNRYSDDISFLGISGSGKPPIILGPSIRVGDLYHTPGGDFALYAQQSSSQVRLVSLAKGPHVDLTVYSGKGQITYRVMEEDSSSITIAVSDSAFASIRVLTISISGETNIVSTTVIDAWQNIKSFDTADVDRDGDTDIVFISYSVPRCTMGVLYNPGVSGGEWRNITMASIVEYPVALDLDDIDGDGYPDMDIVDRYGNHYIYHNSGGTYEGDNAVSLGGG